MPAATSGGGSFGDTAYWYFAYPAHALVFRGMLMGIAAAAEREAST